MHKLTLHPSPRQRRERPDSERAAILRFVARQRAYLRALERAALTREIRMLRQARQTGHAA
jgi:hypothetical protein